MPVFQVELLYGGLFALQGVTGSSMGGFALYFSLSPLAIIPPLILIWMVRWRMKTSSAPVPLTGKGR